MKLINQFYRYNKLLQEVITEASTLNIPISPNIQREITINTRSKKRLGQCKKRENKFIIELSHVFAQADDFAVKQTLAHEILHTVKDCFNHGQTWKHYAAKMNNAYGYNITRTNTCENIGIQIKEQIQQSAKYTIQCKQCKNKIYRERQSKLTKNVNRYRCGKCRGELELL